MGTRAPAMYCLRRMFLSSTVLNGGAIIMGTELCTRIYKPYEGSTITFTGYNN